MSTKAPRRSLTRDEEIARKVDELNLAYKRAAETARCKRCGYPDTAAVSAAEHDLIYTVRHLFELDL